jgi:hypothetical protein
MNERSWNVKRKRTQAPSWRWLAFAQMLTMLGSSCDASEPVARGDEGESCQSRSDCASGLACFDNRCLRGDEPADGESDAGASALPDPRGGPGESCTHRGDCSSGLACIAQVCVERGDLSPSGLGERGESCAARNDCADDLACIANRCVTREADAALEAKQCVRIQCERSEDCCEKFVAPIACPGWKEACTGGDTAACSSFQASCVCNMQCRSSSCQPVRSCTDDAECAPLGQRCVSGACAQCQADADCPMDGQRCVGSICSAGCERAEQCPLFHECSDGACLEVGCTSDRECLFATKNTLARCLMTECVVPCQSDAQCPELQLCEAERCTFVGCQSDEECRVYLNLANQAGPDRAVCREPDR